jgi:ATP synthase protein I
MGSKMQENAPKNKPKVGMNFLLIGSGQLFTSLVIAGFVVGYAFDYFLETTPIFMMLCGLLGIIGGSQKVHRILSRMEQNEQKKDADAS